MSAKDSPKDCGKHKRHHLFRRIFGCLGCLVIAVLITVLVIWLVLRPTKPRFSLQDAAVYQLNLSSSPPSELTTILQVTIAARNPNDRIGIFYDRLDVYATYRSQQITLSTPIRPSYQGHKDIAVWSPYLSGNAVPIAPYLYMALAGDEGSGRVLLYIKINGKVRWKVGSWTSGRYHLYVNCPALLSFNGGATPLPSIKFQQMSRCSVSV